MEKVIITQEELEQTFSPRTKALQGIEGNLDNLVEAVANPSVDIVNALDEIKDAINNCDNGSYFHEIKGSLDNLTDQTSHLNNTLRDLAQIIRNK